jgi:2-amino-4-hydroxy-6-hydroxymethyldihydropteridine diphosphokinase
VEKMNHAILSLGSNIEDRVLHLKNALHLLNQKVGVILQKSSVYETEAIGFISDIPFYNMCVEIKTFLSPELLLKKTQEIEIEIGRKNKSSEFYESRKIDIDIIFYGSVIIETDRLSIPHKHYANRKFVLIPLCDLKGEIIDPNSSLSVNETLRNCTDNSNVKRSHIAI